MSRPGRLRAGALLAVLLGLLLGGALEDETQLGLRAWERGELAMARTHWGEALRHAEAAGDAPSQVALHLRLAAVSRRQGHLDEATGHLDAAAAAGDPRDPILKAQLLDARGLVHLAAGDGERAERVLRRAFGAYQGAEDPVGAAGAAVNLGAARLSLGHLDEAERALEGAVTLYETLGDPVGEADALTTLGAVRRRQGELRQARDDLKRAQELFQEARRPEGLADAQQNLAMVMLDLGQIAAARSYLNSALVLARQRADLPRQGALLQDLAAIEHTAGDLDAARTGYRAAEATWTAAGREDEARRAAVSALVLSESRGGLEDLADAARETGDDELEAYARVNLAALVRADDPDAALHHAERALDLSEARSLADLRWRARAVQGLSLLDLERTDDGVAALQTAVDELERRRRRLGSVESRQFALTHEPVYQALINALLDSGDALRAMVYAERLQLATLGSPPLPDDPEVARYEALVDRQAWLEDELADELASNREAERAAALREQLASLRVEFAATVDELRSSYDNFDELVRVDPEDLEAIQADLEPGVFVLQPILFEDRLMLMLFSRDRVIARQVDVDGAQVAYTLRRLGRHMQKWDRIYKPEEMRALTEELGAWLWAPIAADLHGAKVLAVSASGDFRQLPFGILRHGGRYLIQDMAVVNVTHAGSLRAGEAPFHLRGDQLLLVGNPAGDLPEAEAEVEAISRTFPGSTRLTGAQAGHDQLLQLLAGKSAVHLATHGYLDPQQPTRSYLLLAAGDGGTLTYREIPGLAPYLQACRMVVLSACESGLPMEARGDDSGTAVSINGLAAQFRRAGVETLVASLWKVDDEATRLLMETFYAHLKTGMGVGLALQQAQLAVLARPEFREPAFWGAFVVVGDWR